MTVPAALSRRAVLRSESWRTAALGLAAGATATAFIRRGAFFYPDSLWFAGALAVASIVVVRRLDRAERAVVVAALSFAGFWLWRAVPIHVPHRVVLLPASVGAMTAAWLLGRALDDRRRAVAERLLVAGGAGLAIVGVVGVALRIYPLAMPHGGLWRAATTLTYANAAGLACALVLPLCLRTQCVPVRWQRLATFAVTAGLMATMSRGAFVAAAVALVVARAWRSPALLAALLGGAAGLIVAVNAGGATRRPELLVVGAALAVIATVLGQPRRLASWLALGAVAACAGVVLVLGSHAPLAGRADPASFGERAHEWQAAEQQFRAHPLVGAGPERLLVLNGSEVTYFAHNEYAQVAAGGGVAALVLLGLLGLLLLRATVRMHAPPWALAVLAAAAVGAAFDFTWHLPALGALAGWLLGVGRSET